MVKYLIQVMLLLSFISLVQAEEKYEFETEQQRADFLLLSKELRCPKCQNQNIADSNALIANDMKRKVHQLLLEGKSQEEVINFMKSRYGEFVHYQPPMTPVTLWLYFGPLLFIAACIAYFVLSRKKARRLSPGSGKADPDEIAKQEKLKRAESALKDIS